MTGQKNKRVLKFSNTLLFMSSWILIAGPVSPDLAANRKGDIVLVWSDGLDIYASYHRNNLEIRTATFKIGGLAGQDNHPAVSLDDHGNGIVVWENVRKDTVRIYMRWFKKDFKDTGEIIPVADSEFSASQTVPDVATCRSGKFLIVWVDYRNRNADIFARLYHSKSGKFGREFRINDDTLTVMQNFPYVEANQDKFIVVWEDHRKPYSFIYGQIINQRSGMKGKNFCVNDTESGSSWGVYASATIDVSGSFVVAWKDYRNGHSDIYAQRFDSKRKPAGINIRVNDDPGPGWQRLAVITVMPDCGYLVVWEDYRNDDLINQKGDVYGQRFDQEFRPVNGNMLINHSSEPSAQIRPLAVLLTDDAAILWEDERPDSCHISFQYLNRIENPPNCLHLSL